MSSDPLSLIEPEEAADLLEEVETVGRSTRRLLQADGWQWMTVWTLVCLGAGVSALLRADAGLYWAVAVPIGLAATATIDRRASRRRPVQRRGWPYWTIGLAITAINFGASVVLPGEVMAVWVWAVIGLGFVGFAQLERQPWAAALMAGLTLVSVLSGQMVRDPLRVYVTLAFLYATGLAGVAVGIKTRALESGRR